MAYQTALHARLSLTKPLVPIEFGKVGAGKKQQFRACVRERESEREKGREEGVRRGEKG